MIELLFITSNRAKLENARFLCRNYAIIISKQKQYGIGYIEPRIKNREELLDQSIKDAVKRLGKVSTNIGEKFVFIEDTSVIIDGFSSLGNEVPGVDVKYWMQEMNFEKLDNQLKEIENNRRVTVRSDIILFLPKQLQSALGILYKHFNGQTSGTITPKEFELSTQPLYPWLSSKTFNKWFIPDRSDKPLSLLDIEQAEKEDFRKGAFDEMLLFLKEHGLTRRKATSISLFKQMNLFNLKLFIICGGTCAGKTTLAEYLTEKYSVYHIEASDFMYLSYYEKHGPFSDVKIGDYARQALIDNPNVVVDQIVAHLNELRRGKFMPIVISGFRAPEEIRGFKMKYSGDLDIEVIFIDASVKIRYERCFKRGRNDKVKSIDDFLKIDTQQNEMGLQIIKQEIGEENIIINEGSINKYFENFEKRFEDNFMYLENQGFDTLNTAEKVEALKKVTKLEHAILIALSSNNVEYFTTTQISHLINSTFNFKIPKGKDNVSRYFNHNYHPFYEIRVEEGKTKYKLSQTGYSYSQIIKRQFLS